MRAPAVHTTNWNTRANRLRVAQAKGRPSGLARGSWIADLVALKKAITLCMHCMPKFDHKANHYSPRTITPSHPFVTAECDGCGSPFARCKLYRHEEVR